MGRKAWFLVSLLNLCFFVTHAQAIDNSVSFRNIPSDQYFRINYENDFFAASDRDYTQGIFIEKVHPIFSKFFLTKLLWHPAHNHLRYGIGIEHNAYTPNQIDKSAIQYGDRPYAGVLLLKTFLIADDTVRHLRTEVSLSTGVLGRAAGGEQMQRTIHHWIHYTQPEGWDNQIQNDLVLNYQLTMEKQLYQYAHHFLISGYGSLSVGTLSDKISGGFTIRLGTFQSPFSIPETSIRTFQWFAYWNVTGNAVAYDATLQGGFFNRSSVYTIPSGDISRFVLQNRYGLVILFKSLYLEYYRSGTTEEYHTGIFHRTGGLQIGFGFSIP